MKDDDLSPLVRFALALFIGVVVGHGLIAAILLSSSIVARLLLEQ